MRAKARAVEGGVGERRDLDTLCAVGARRAGGLAQAGSRVVWLRRQAAGGAPNSRRKARLNAVSVW